MRRTIEIAGLAALLIAACQGPDEYFWGQLPDAGIGGAPLAGHGGSPSGTGGAPTGIGGMPTGLGGMPTGTAGDTGSGGAAGSTGAAGSVGRGGTTGSAGAGGAGTGRGGTTGSAGSTGAAGSVGRGGTTGSAGAGGAGTGRGGTTGSAGAGGAGTGRGGTTGSAGSTGTGGTPATVLYTEDFEGETVGATSAADWSRTGGSSNDWTIATDGTKVLEQSNATSSTLRVQSLTGAPGAPWSGAVSVSARVKLLMTGSSAQAALLCVRYNDMTNRYCAALVPNGVQIQTSVGGAAAQSSVFTATVTTGTFYDLRISVDASNLLTVYLGGTQRGTYMPGAMTNGTVALGTTSMEAAFDNISVTRP